MFTIVVYFMGLFFPINNAVHKEVETRPKCNAYNIGMSRMDNQTALSLY